MDTHHSFLDQGQYPFGYKCSIRKPPDQRPVILIGQDESTFHQYIFSNRNWVNNKGSSPILPKGFGDMLMISGMQSQKTGVGL